MGIFGKKKDAEAMADVMSQVQRAQGLAAQSTANFEQQTGMNVESLQAQAMAMVQSGEMQRLQAYAARASRLYQAGVDTPGTLRTASFGPASPMIDGVPVQYRVSVEPAGAAPYDVDSDQVVDDSLARALTPGRRLTVRVDPADPRSLMIWGVDAPTPPDDKRAQRMAKLQSLLALGVVTQAEFDVAQQKI